MSVSTVAVRKEDIKEIGYKEEFSNKAGLAFIASLPLEDSIMEAGLDVYPGEFTVYVYAGEEAFIDADGVVKYYRQTVPLVSYMDNSLLFHDPYVPIITVVGIHYPLYQIYAGDIVNSSSLFDEDKFYIQGWKDKRYIKGAKYDSNLLYTRG